MNKISIKDSIAKWVLGGYSYVGKPNGKSYLQDFSEEREDFARLVFLNIVEILTDLTDDVTLLLKSGNSMRFAEFKLFFETYGQLVFNTLYLKGIAVIAYSAAGFELLEPEDYTIDSTNKIKPQGKYKNREIYVMKSNTLITTGSSDRVLLNGFLKYLDNVLNASNTTTARLGSLIMASPEQASGLPIMVKVTDDAKKEIEDEISNNYGGLKNQKQILIWRQPMKFTTVNLSGLDAKTIEKSKFAISAICDRIKVPATQISIIESSSNSNSLSAGGQVSEGDLLKYKTFERLLNRTFIKMARDLDLIVDYSIYNKPITTPTAQPIL